VDDEYSRETLLGPPLNEAYLSDVLNQTRRRLDSLEEKARLARNESMLDPLTLFVLSKVVHANGLHVKSLDDVLANGTGWARLMRLMQAGVLDLAGDFVEVTDLGRQAFTEAIKLRQPEND
jgi:hypothetical protein